jgi:hypothetical protein
MLRSLLAAALLGMLATPLMAAESGANPNAWLVGDWMLCKDPDRSSKDTLRFAADGTGAVLRSKGNIETVYRVRESRVELLANANGRAIPITLTFTAARDVLTVHSDDTGASATYVRKDGKRVGECDA